MNTKGDVTSPIGKITSGISLGALAYQTIDFVRKQLPAWRDDPDRQEEQAENKLNSQLCKFLDAHARTEFPMVQFTSEELQTGQRRVDLAASPTEIMVIQVESYSKKHTIYDPILVLEGKRLPAPSSDRQKEYVTGMEKKSGGIQRFKLGLHGAKLSIAAMIGYVQERTISYWEDQINQWISELADGTVKDNCDWARNEQLEAFDENKSKDIGCYRSIHSRTGKVKNDTIELNHLWITMKK
jgi:hypothetical protein